MHFYSQQVVQDDNNMSPTKVVESVLREMVDLVVNGDAQNILQPLPPTELGLAKDTVSQFPTKWYDQCLFECLRCEKRDYDVRRMKRHCRKVHGDSKCQKKLRDVVYQCSLCGREMSCDAITIETHARRSHHGFNNLGEFSEAYTIDEHLAAIKDLSDETAASIRSAELRERQRNGTINGRVS